MRNFKLLLLIYFIISFFGNASNAQEPLNTQIAKFSISRNPALAGLTTPDLQFNFSHQYQNKKIFLPYESLQAEIISNYPFANSQNGLSAGAFIKYDEAGINHLKTASFLPYLNFHQSLSDVEISYLSFAFCAGIYKTQFDFNTLPTILQYNPVPFSLSAQELKLANPNSSSYIDFSTGLSFYTELNPFLTIYMGMGLFHFSQNTIKLNTDIPKQNRTWVINSGMIWKNQLFHIELMADLRMNQLKNQFYTAAFFGFPILKNPFRVLIECNIGTYYNTEGMLAPTITFKFPNFSIGMSYDNYIGINNRLPFLNNAIESTFTIDVNCHKRNNESEKMRCKF